MDELKKLDYNLAVLSNKPHDFTVAYINYIFKNYNFKEVHGQKKEVPKIPDYQKERTNSEIQNYKKDFVEKQYKKEANTNQDLQKIKIILK